MTAAPTPLEVQVMTCKSLGFQILQRSAAIGDAGTHEIADILLQHLDQFDGIQAAAIGPADRLRISRRREVSMRPVDSNVVDFSPMVMANE